MRLENEINNNNNINETRFSIGQQQCHQSYGVVKQYQQYISWAEEKENNTKLNTWLRMYR